MNATRRFAKKGSDVVKYSYESAKTSLTSTTIQGVLIVILIIYSAIVIKYLPLDFLQFFDNMIVKIVVLVIIAFVGLYSPAVALFLAIALICTLQMSQKKKLSDAIRNTTVPSPHEESKVMKKMDVLRDKLKQSMEKYSNEEKQEEDYQDDNDEQNGYDSFGNMVQETANNEPTYGQQYLDPEIMSKMKNVMRSGKDKILKASDKYLPMEKEPVDSDSPAPFNNDESCLSCSNGGDSDPALNSQCGNVKTWKDQFSAQGLGMDIPGFQSSLGYPL